MSDICFVCGELMGWGDRVHTDAGTRHHGCVPFGTDVESEQEAEALEDLEDYLLNNPTPVGLSAVSAHELVEHGYTHDPDRLAITGETREILPPVEGRPGSGLSPELPMVSVPETILASMSDDELAIRIDYWMDRPCLCTAAVPCVRCRSARTLQAEINRRIEQHIADNRRGLPGEEEERS